MLSRVFLLAAFILADTSVASASQGDRKATVEDISGVKTDVTGVQCEPPRASEVPGLEAMNSIMLLMETQDFSVIIPITRVRSITMTAGIAAISYDWQGQTRTARGKALGECRGKSEFGPLIMSLSKIRKLTFSTPPLDAPPSRDGLQARAATVETTKGHKFNATMLSCVGISDRFFSSITSGDYSFDYIGRPTEGIILDTKYFSAAILLARMQSIKIRAPVPSPASKPKMIAEVAYDSHGQTRTLSGEPRGAFYGESDVGYIYVSVDNLRQMNFSTPPAAAKPADHASFQAGAYPATVTLVDGSRMTLMGFRRSATYYSTTGYLIGGAIQTFREIDVRFERGGLLAAPQFDSIAKVEFGPKESVTLTMRNGSSTTGRLPSKDSDRPTSWTGESELTWISIPPESVRVIEFGDPSKFK